MKTLLETTLASLLFLSLAACGLHAPQADQGAMTLPEVFIETQAPEAESPALGRWWEIFDDAALNRLQEEALTHNLDVAQAQARLSQAEALARIGSAALFPTLNVGGKAGRDQQQGTAGEVTVGSQSLSVAAGYEVDLWQKLRAKSEAAGLTARASREDLKALYMRLTAQVADLYYLGVEKRAQLALSDRIIATLTDTLTRVERRYQAGIVGPLDLYQARQNLLEAKESRPQFAAALATSNHALSVLLGRFPDNAPAGNLAELPMAPEAFRAGLPASLLKNRPDLTAAFLRLAAKDAEVAAAVAERFPTVNLLASYGTGRTDLGSLVTSGPFWSLLAQLSAPVFDAGRRRAEVERSQAAFAEAVAFYRQTVLRAVQEVEDALAQNRASEERLALLAARNEATEASLRLSEYNYFEGLSEYLPVLVAQQLHFKTQSTLLAARRQLLAGRISLARSLGGSWFETTLAQHLASGKESDL
ncbi:efflux transporter outer membrane subunit [Thiovibrio sp. JS02]